MYTYILEQNDARWTTEADDVLGALRNARAERAFPPGTRVMISKELRPGSITPIGFTTIDKE